jgi:hypothetical protein
MVKVGLLIFIARFTCVASCTWELDNSNLPFDTFPKEFARISSTFPILQSRAQMPWTETCCHCHGKLNHKFPSGVHHNETAKTGLRKSRSGGGICFLAGLPLQGRWTRLPAPVCTAACSSITNASQRCASLPHAARNDGLAFRSGFPRWLLLPSSGVINPRRPATSNYTNHAHVWCGARRSYQDPAKRV